MKPWVTASVALLLVWLLFAAAKAQEQDLVRSFSGIKILRDVWCDDRLMLLKCPASLQLKIVDAFYGRLVSGDRLCPYSPSQERETSTATNCSTKAAKSVILRRCENKNRCSVRVTSKIFGDGPCPSVPKYLEVKYQCVPLNSSLNQHQHCKGPRNLSLFCDRNQRIGIIRAWFGWDSILPSKCVTDALQSPLPLVDIPTSCQSRDILSDIAPVCSGRRYCAVSLTSLSADECSAYAQYATVAYMCEPKQVPVAADTLADSPEPGVPKRIAAPFQAGITDRPFPIRDPDPLQRSTTSTTTGPTTAPTTAPTASIQTGTTTTLSPDPVPIPDPIPTEDSSVRTGGQRLMDRTNKTCNFSGHHDHAVTDTSILVSWVYSVNFISENQEKMVLYICLSGSLGLMAAMCVVMVRLAYRHSRQSHATRSYLASHHHHHHKFNVTGGPLGGPLDGPLGNSMNIDHSNEENTYIPAGDPSDMDALQYNLGTGSRGGGTLGTLYTHRPNIRTSYYENDERSGEDRHSLFDGGSEAV